MSASSPAQDLADAPLRLGLIGDNIAASRSPRLHRLAGLQNHRAVTYDRLVPREIGQPFETILRGCAAQGYRGVNVTYPYKERAAAQVQIDDPLVRAIGSVNTVVFTPQGARGYSTDYTGFVAAYRRVRGEAGPGVALMIGTGGVGRAVAFGLLALGAAALHLVDRDRAKADGLAASLRAAAPGVRVRVFDTVVEAAAGADGIINCTPVGMIGHPGSPVEAARLAGAGWAFDAVYTPVDTLFLRDAEAAGLAIISGWELFFFQGAHAWQLFSGLPLDEAALRRDLLADRG